MSVAAPARIRIRMYRVGFGDCFLLSFEYDTKLDDGRSERHILIDFGSNHPAPGGTDLVAVAKLVAAHCGGKLDAIVVTHRHKDHVSGFGMPDAAKVITGLKPRLVVRPWTEDPSAKKSAKGKTKAFLAGLDAGQAFAGRLGLALGAGARGIQGDLRDFAMQQIANQAAIDNLDAWAKAGKGTYVSTGDPSGLDALLPGVTVSVLGPPTIDEWPEVQHESATDPEYWMLLGHALDEGALPTTPLDAEDGKKGKGPVGALGPERWLIANMKRQHVELLERIVATMDKALNNTSVILLFETGDRRLLFSGDAQIENWDYFFKKFPKRAAALTKLKAVDVYKVGHHGSRNATPKQELFGLWKGTNPMSFLCSTEPGVYGTTEATKVPRATLVAALAQRGQLYESDKLATGQAFVEVWAPASGAAGFKKK